MASCLPAVAALTAGAVARVVVGTQRRPGERCQRCSRDTSLKHSRSQDSHVELRGDLGRSPARFLTYPQWGGLGQYGSRGWQARVDVPLADEKRSRFVAYVSTKLRVGKDFRSCVMTHVTCSHESYHGSRSRSREGANVPPFTHVSRFFSP